MLATILVLFTVVLAILCFHLYARWLLLRRLRHRRRQLLLRRRRLHPPSSSSAGAPSRGLDPALLASLPVFVYPSKGAETGLIECSVCLSEFEEGEKGRRLPACEHAFHTDCIDAWFGSHDTCPLCRSTVDAPPSEAIVVPIEDPVAPPLPPSAGDVASSSVGSRIVSLKRILSLRGGVFCGNNSIGCSGEVDLESRGGDGGDQRV
ncbi:RING-H2 finger protein ATL5 [Acorus gramineus]|uniref:RING-type E3 ubiquitin transferase n=1 Tax=Acorus gramineus TaxID=55184 RepID=A0AAV9BWG4_ACOGR|nr:RING-H2 finger protein ATL5 [Acorus gramineus]